MSSSSLSGRFIVLDGSEGCGKSTQTRLLAQRLESLGIPHLLVRDPGTTRIGEQIRALLLNPDHQEMAMRCEMLLYMAARAQMMSQIINPALQEQKMVICDRFISSTLAYQLGGDGLTADDIRAIGDVAINHRWPDLTLILDLPVEISSARVKPKFIQPDLQPGKHTQAVKDRIERRPPEYHEQVRSNYLDQAKANPDRYRVIDASQSPEQVHEAVWREILKLTGEDQ